MHRPTAPSDPTCRCADRSRARYGDPAAYRTLQGHLEMGQMDYEVWKWLDTGRVEFRIHAYSRRARIRNPALRLGFRLIGRREQVRFARHACARMARACSPT